MPHAFDLTEVRLCSRSASVVRATLIFNGALAVRGIKVEEEAGHLRLDLPRARESQSGPTREAFAFADEEAKESVQGVLAEALASVWSTAPPWDLTRRITSVTGGGIRLRVSSVEVELGGEPPLVARADLTLNDAIRIVSIRLFKSPNGIFRAWPVTFLAEGDWRNLVYINHTATDRHVERELVLAYESRASQGLHHEEFR